ncbi:MAG: peptidyl-prolyl cis-trans isomerase [Rhodospirillales bacterium]|nr:peptidyl-prolyl cis-trans isomerase [Rhodospirillales bacterium]
MHPVLRPNVIDSYTLHQEAARARAEAIAARVDKGETLDAAAASFQLKPAAIPASLRPGFGQPQGGTPLEVTGRLFALKVGEAGVAPGREGYHVVRLTEILPADPAADAAGVERVAEQLRRDVAGDLLGEFTEALKRRYGVEIDRAAIDRQL